MEEINNKKSKYGFIKWLAFAFAGLYFYKKKNKKELKVVDNVDLEKYSGKWYEIAAIPEKHQKGCSNITAEYTTTNEGFLKIVNSCNEDIIEEIEKKVKGKAYPVSGSNNAKLKVEFKCLFKSDYWIIDLDKDYKYVMVGHPDRKYLWILSRKPKLSQDIYDSLIKKAELQGFNIKKIRKTEHYKTKKSLAGVS